MSAAKSSCTIETASYQEGVWHVYANISTPQGARSGPHQIEGDPEMTDAALKAAVLALYS